MARRARPDDPLACGTDSAVEDLRAIMDWLQGQGVAHASLLGWSWGARIIGHYTAGAPQRVSRVVFLGPAIGGGDPILPAPTEPWWFNTREEYRNRLDPTMMDADALEALIDHITTNDPKAPNAIRVENANGSVPIDPASITCPTLLVYGSEGGKAAYMKGVMARTDFFERLTTRDKILAVVPESSDYAMFQRRRRQVQQIVAGFLQIASVKQKPIIAVKSLFSPLGQLPSCAKGEISDDTLQSAFLELKKATVPHSSKKAPPNLPRPALA